MTSLALIACATGPDLLHYCLASLKRFAPEVDRMVIQNGEDPLLTNYLVAEAVPHIENPYVEHSARDHASAFEFAREMGFGTQHDVVIFLDSDCAILSPAWIEWLRTHFQECPKVGVIGAAHVQDTTRCHASMLALRAPLFPQMGTLHALRVGTHPWRDTAGRAQDILVSLGWEIETMGSELDGARYYPNKAQALWAHLGSGHVEPMRPAVRTWATAKALAGGRLAQKALQRDARRFQWLTMMKERLG